MSRKLKIDLPGTQTIHFADKSFWEMLRVYSVTNGLTISELVELSIKEFLVSDNSKQIIAKYKIMKELGLK